MEKESSSKPWNWNDPAECTTRLDGARAETAVCEKLEVIADDAPFSGRRLRALGVTGLEFAAFRSTHPSGLAADYVPIACSGEETGLRQIYRVDSEYSFLRADISEELPFEDHSVEWVYAEHLIEHVTLDRAIAWLQELKRILVHGGLLRLTTPDLVRYATNYLNDDGFFSEHRDRMLDALTPAPRMPPRPAFMLNQIFYFYGHRWIYDLEELRYALVSAGFESDQIRQCAFGEGAQPQIAGLDRPIRNDETLYIEAHA